MSINFLFQDKDYSCYGLLLSDICSKDRCYRKSAWIEYDFSDRKKLSLHLYVYYYMEYESHLKCS